MASTLARLSKYAKGENTTSVLSHAKAAYVAQTAPKEFKHIAVAVEKATNDDVVSPKEKHVQTLLEVVRSGASVADVTFLVNYLNHQVTDCKRVTQMLKTHVLLHRLLLDSGEEFRTQIMKMHKWVVEDRNTDSTLKCLFSIRAWKDEANMEVSGWCRTYASYLDEFVSNWEDFSDFARINKNPQGDATQMRSLPADELVRKLPKAQLLMRRIIDCEAINESLTANEVVIAATRLLFKDSFKWYHMCNDGVIRLIDLFFDMNKHHAAKALEMYKKATTQGDDLSRMYRNAEENWLAFRSEKFPAVENPPGSFLQTMEEYVKNAPAEGKGPAPSPPRAAARPRRPHVGPPRRDEPQHSEPFATGARSGHLRRVRQR